MEPWQESRDAIVRAAITAMAEAGGGLDVLAMQAALEAAFKEAARQRLEEAGADSAWFVMSRHRSRMEAP
jgi:hypothetical protein